MTLDELLERLSEAKTGIILDVIIGKKSAKILYLADYAKGMAHEQRLEQSQQALEGKSPNGA